ncbi:hypothetical protein LSCM1_05874 [Leishmania martiniquensis]|uniref:Calcium uniporter protein C-terminal domain-containing protein n=1 Tax=Leishmania martiniquensis TaxID=1580590 RepID=A0A836HDA7_9TRYP|nr:hypothetical protein LSCM1_05874 [Leishmania martiniquensis]
MKRLTRTGGAVCSARRHSFFPLWTTPASLRCHGTTAADAAATAKLTSPGAPLDHVFKLVPSCSAASSSSARRSAVVLHTSYAPPLPSDEEAAHDVCCGSDTGAGEGSTKTTHLTATPSYAVKDVAAFEQLIEEALRLSQVTLEATVTASAAPTSQVGAHQAPTTLLSDHTTRELQVLLAEAERALAPLTARKKIDSAVYGVYLPLLRYGAFACLAVQLVVYLRWIFVVFDWDWAEPTTYFLSYTGVFCSLVYHYYRCGEDGFTWKHIFDHLANRKAERMYAKEQLDVIGMTQLQRRITLIKEELARVSLSR